jgi:hypothetical protein
MSKQTQYYRRLYQLKESLQEFARMPIDGNNVEDAEIRLHAVHVVAHLEKRIENLRGAMSSAEMAEIIRE